MGVFLCVLVLPAGCCCHVSVGILVFSVFSLCWLGLVLLFGVLVKMFVCVLLVYVVLLVSLWLCCRFTLPVPVLCF